MAQTSCGDEKQLLIYEKGKQRHRAPCWIGLLGSRLGAPEAFPAPAPREGSGPALPSPAQGAAPSPCPTAPCWRSAPEGPRVMVAGVTRRTGICRGWHQRRTGGFPAVGSGRSPSPCQAHSRMLGRATTGISKHPALDVFWDSQQSQLWGHPAVGSPSCTLPCCCSRGTCTPGTHQREKPQLGSLSLQSPREEKQRDPAQQNQAATSAEPGPLPRGKVTLRARGRASACGASTSTGMEDAGGALETSDLASRSGCFSS